eukprot:TRINITY_DN102_c0_g6_i2.p1 TRINITY_DN102_c0_g6~~TRINITY_DN102_c0_g6_i2.p1  ORF type:complete len:185 (+),score=12.47 TRINITY_DN102_c0_g6_i2:867-1421(+)
MHATIFQQLQQNNKKIALDLYGCSTKIKLTNFLFSNQFLNTVKHLNLERLQFGLLQFGRLQFGLFEVVQIKVFQIKLPTFQVTYMNYIKNLKTDHWLQIDQPMIPVKTHSLSNTLLRGHNGKISEKQIFFLIFAGFLSKILRGLQFGPDFNLDHFNLDFSGVVQIKKLPNQSVLQQFFVSFFIF